ncbi:hypothetical protein GCM10010343_65950 [Streptomyces avidinii]|nr:hypothetical protein GCM10010343_65950 [Streptomyces avidinii]
MPSAHTLPVLDLSQADDPAQRADFLKKLHAAARDSGFLHLTGTASPPPRVPASWN